MMRDAQTEKIRIENAARKRDEGWWTQDEASQDVTGKAAAFPEPVRTPVTSGGPSAQENPEPGSSRRTGEVLAA